LACPFKDKCFQFNQNYYCCTECPVEAIVCFQFDQYLYEEGIGEEVTKIAEEIRNGKRGIGAEEPQEIWSITTIFFPRKYLEILNWLVKNKCYQTPDEAIVEGLSKLIEEKSWEWRKKVTIQKIMMRPEKPHFLLTGLF